MTEPQEAGQLETPGQEQVAVTVELDRSAAEVRSWLKGGGAGSCVFMDSKEFLSAARALRTGMRLRAAPSEERQRLDSALAPIQRWAREHPDGLIGVPQVHFYDLPALTPLSHRMVEAVFGPGALVHGAPEVTFVTMIEETSAGSVWMTLAGSQPAVDEMKHSLERLCASEGEKNIQRWIEERVASKDTNSLMCYYEEEKRRNRKYTLKALAKACGYSLGHMKNLHAAWKREQRPKT